MLVNGGLKYKVERRCTWRDVRVICPASRVRNELLEVTKCNDCLVCC